jgi:hypothetical protein
MKGDDVTATTEKPSGTRITDDSLKVRQITHYQFSFTAGSDAEPGLWTLQLVLDEGAWEEVLTLTASDADNLQDSFTSYDSAWYDVGRRVIMFGTRKPGH